MNKDEVIYISNSMGKHPWRIGGISTETIGHGEVASHLTIRDSDDYGKTVANVYDCRDMDKQKANAFAITSAVNNTWGKGFNPEKVEDMYNMLERCTWTADIHEIQKELRQLLSDIKLK